jgi:hypothetical protein
LPHLALRRNISKIDPLTREEMITMSTPVFPLVLGQGFKEAWYQLSKQEQDDLWAQVEEVDRQAGAVWRIVCDSRWADESLFDWGVLSTRTSMRTDGRWLGWRNSTGYRYWSGKTILGTEMDLNRSEP